MFQGKGFYIWQVARCEGGDVGAMGNLATQAQFSHVLVKIADASSAYNVTATGVDLARNVVIAMHERNILCLGWHYVYGYDPVGEANIAIQRIQQTGVDGYVIDAEAQYKEPGKEEAARIFMSRLRQVLPTFPIALSSYRYPTLHPQLPWTAFLEKCDYNMPQVYWVGAHNPGDQLIRCVREFQNITPWRPIIPTGSAYLQGDWRPTMSDIEEFLRVAQNLNLAAANFWEWAHTRLYLPELWNAVAAYPWPPSSSNVDIVMRYIQALNSRDVQQVLALYQPNAVYVTPQRTLQGHAAIAERFQQLFTTLLPQAVFTLVDSSGSLGSRAFTWRAVSSAGSVNDGADNLGIVGNQIVYHYSQFTISS
jgi:hypothetical protein